LPSLAILVPLLLVMLVAANGALTTVPPALTGPAPALTFTRLVGIGIAGAAADDSASDATAVGMHGAAASATQASPSGLLGPAEASLAPIQEIDAGAPRPTDELADDVPVVQAAFAAAPPAVPYRLPVPFHSQKDGDRFQGSNCGPAALGMVLRAFGMEETNAQLRLISHTYQGTVGYRGGTALQYVAAAGRDFGIDPVGLYDGANFHRWSIDEIRAELDLGRPVVPLVKYRLLPGHEVSTIRFDHYIVIHGTDGDRFLYHDPAYENPADGASRWISAEQLGAAMYASIVPGQAVAFAPGTHAALAALSA
jgi:hypothetical protein